MKFLNSSFAITAAMFLAAIIGFCGVAHAGNVVYDVDFTVTGGVDGFSTDTIMGSITTNGASTIGANSIVSFDLTTSSGGSYDGTFVQCGSACGLIVSGNSLSFNFGSHASELLALQNAGNGVDLQFLTNYPSDATGALRDVGGGGNFLSTQDVVIGVAAVPLPASAWLMLGSLGGLGFAMRKRST